MFSVLQMLKSIGEIDFHNQELIRKYRKEMKLRKKYHNELVDLKGQSAINSVVPRRSGCDLNNVIFNLVLWTGFSRSSHEIDLR